MNRITAGLALALAFTLGCLATEIARETIVPETRATPSPGQRWAYACVENSFLNLEKRDKWLNELGESGWEMVSFQNQTYCFKQPS